MLDAIVERGRALVEARALIILLREGDELVVAATAAVAGGLDPKVAHLRFRSRTASEQVLLGRITGSRIWVRGERPCADRAARSSAASRSAWSSPSTTSASRASFDDEDQRLLEAFAASAATGVATARSMAEERLQNTIEAAEQERGRWARELHDETLQALAVLRMRLVVGAPGEIAGGARTRRARRRWSRSTTRS